MRMKLGIHCWALPPQMTIEEKIRFAARIGFDGIELSITDDGPLSFDAPHSSRERIRKVANDYGIVIHSLTCSLNWQCSLTSNEKKHREKAMDNLRRQIDIASEIDCEAILALPGFVGLDFKTNDLFDDPNTQSYFPGVEVIDYSLAYERSLNAFKSIASYAETSKVLVCVENIWNKFLLSPLEFKRFLDDCQSQYKILS